MKDTLTIQLDSDLVRRAHAEAERRGTALSEVIEDVLRATIAPGTTPAPVAQDWRSTLTPEVRALIGSARTSPQDDDPEGAHRAYLINKHS